MAARTRHLGGVNSSPPSTPPPPSKEPRPDVATMDSDLEVIVAALLCALICVLGLVVVSRCSWIRRFRGRTSAASAPPPPAANKGVKKKVLKSLPKQTVGEDETEKFSDCAICLLEYAAGDEIRVLPQCAHAFHVECIDTWLGSHPSCPSCRAILVVERCKKCGGLPATTNSATAGTQGGSKKEVFQVIQDRVWKKLKGWKEKFLSQAGREVLIKAVAQAIPMYSMQVFKMPMSIILELEKMCRGFFWGQKSNERKRW